MVNLGIKENILGIMTHFVRRICYALKFRKKKVKLCRGTNIRRGTKFEGSNVIGYNTDYKGHIGYGSYIGEDCKINADVGRYCCIGNSVITINGFHPSNTFVSIHPAFFSTAHSDLDTYVDQDFFEEHRYIDRERGIGVKIGNDVWIGTRVSIIAGVTIGDGAIIATGAVVVKDVAPYSIYGGVPAKLIRWRFEEKERGALQKIKWWNKPEAWIREHAEEFRDIHLLLDSIDFEERGGQV